MPVQGLSGEGGAGAWILVPEQALEELFREEEAERLHFHLARRRAAVGVVVVLPGVVRWVGPRPGPGLLVVRVEVSVERGGRTRRRRPARCSGTAAAPRTALALKAAHLVFRALQGAGTAPSWTNPAPKMDSLSPTGSYF